MIIEVKRGSRRESRDARSRIRKTDAAYRRQELERRRFVEEPVEGPLLPEAEQKAFEATFEAAAKGCWPQASRWVIRKEVRTGFKVGAKDGGYYISFSDQDFDALLKEYLRDKVYKMYNARRAPCSTRITTVW